VDFNVSHQAGVVSLIATVGAEGVSVGTDVVCVNERVKHDYEHIDKKGFFDWVDIYADVFADSEVSFMKLGPVDVGTAVNGYERDALSRCQWRGRKLHIRTGEGKEEMESDVVITAKLRRFYAMWCLRETYVKMTGEALLAPWLKELEISNVQTPTPRLNSVGERSLEEGDRTTAFRIHFKEKLVTDVVIELTALGKDYIVGGAVKMTPGVDRAALAMREWQRLDLEKDVLAFGEAMA
jgi:4'-phosphopantetheinyl transferase